MCTDHLNPPVQPSRLDAIHDASSRARKVILTIITKSLPKCPPQKLKKRASPRPQRQRQPLLRLPMARLLTSYHGRRSRAGMNDNR